MFFHRQVPCSRMYLASNTVFLIAIERACGSLNPSDAPWFSVGRWLWVKTDFRRYLLKRCLPRNKTSVGCSLGYQVLTRISRAPGNNVLDKKLEGPMKIGTFGKPTTTWLLPLFKRSPRKRSRLLWFWVSRLKLLCRDLTLLCQHLLNEKQIPFFGLIIFTAKWLSTTPQLEGWAKHVFWEKKKYTKHK